MQKAKSALVQNGSGLMQGVDMAAVFGGNFSSLRSELQLSSGDSAKDTAGLANRVVELAKGQALEIHRGAEVEAAALRAEAAEVLAAAKAGAGAGAGAGAAASAGTGVGGTEGEARGYSVTGAGALARGGDAGTDVVGDAKAAAAAAAAAAAGGGGAGGADPMLDVTDPARIAK
jgi:hypothetical protein